MDILQSFFFLYFTVNFGSEDEGKNSSTKIWEEFLPKMFNDDWWILKCRHSFSSMKLFLLKTFIDDCLFNVATNSCNFFSWNSPDFVKHGIK
jgi:hypothetical protein